MPEIEKNDSDLQALKPSRLRRFQGLFIVFFVFSFVGHYIEVVWAWVKYFTIGSHWFPKIADLIPLAAPYGLGAVALILIIWPIMKKRKLHPVKVFFLSAFVTGAVEFLCAALLVLLYGRNYYWDYSNRAFNLFGFVCLQGVMLFAIASIIFLYFIYPYCEKLFQKFSRRQVSAIFWVLFIAYLINITLVCVREFL